MECPETAKFLTSKSLLDQNTLKGILFVAATNRMRKGWPSKGGSWGNPYYGAIKAWQSDINCCHSGCMETLSKELDSLPSADDYKKSVVLGLLYKVSMYKGWQTSYHTTLMRV